MNENHKEQSMSFDIEQKELLEHLIADTQEVLYENDGIKNHAAGRSYPMPNSA